MNILIYLTNKSYRKHRWASKNLWKYREPEFIIQREDDMTEQEEIREGLEGRFRQAGLSTTDARNFAEATLIDLDSQGVVIKVERELTASICGYCEHLDSCFEEHSECDEFRLSAGYSAFEPLIEGEKC